MGNGLWQLIASAAILLVGFVLLEIAWRSANRRLEAHLEKKLTLKRGGPRETLDMPAFLPPFRLASAALLIRAAEALLVIPVELRQLLHGVEAFFLSLAVILLLFQLVRILDTLRLALSPRVQDTISEQALRKLKGFLRITILVGVATVVIYTQKVFF
ncbi:MAG: hypothetical protein HWN68_07185 [Desulfobacterales bacterium]|nr:hypothetical protein [Desulfobacterales bacterium]